jgi:hypothetical protein
MHAKITGMHIHHPTLSRISTQHMVVWCVLIDVADRPQKNNNDRTNKGKKSFITPFFVLFIFWSTDRIEFTHG